MTHLGTGYLPNKEEEIRFVLDRIMEPLLLDHVRRLLDRGVLVIARKVVQHAERCDFAAPIGICFSIKHTDRVDKRDSRKEE